MKRFPAMAPEVFMSVEPRYQPDRDHIKRAPRIQGCHEATLVDVLGRTYPVTVIDISSGGFRLEGEETFKIGEYVALRVPKFGDFPAQIRWALGREAGGVFLEPIALRED